TGQATGYATCRTEKDIAAAQESSVPVPEAPDVAVRCQASDGCRCTGYFSAARIQALLPAWRGIRPTRGADRYRWRGAFRHGAGAQQVSVRRAGQTKGQQGWPGACRRGPGQVRSPQAGPYVEAHYRFAIAISGLSQYQGSGAQPQGQEWHGGDARSTKRPNTCGGLLSEFQPEQPQ